MEDLERWADGKIKPVTEVHYGGTPREERVVRWANGRTYVEHCVERRAGCTGQARLMVGPCSCCENCAAKRLLAQALDKQRQAEFQASAHGQRMLAEEQKLERQMEMDSLHGRIGKRVADGA